MAAPASTLENENLPGAIAFASAFQRVFGISALAPQVRLANALLRGTFGVAWTIDSCVALRADEIAELLPEEAERRLLVQLLILVQMCGRSRAPRPLHARSLSRFAEALDVREPQLLVGSHAALGRYDVMEHEWDRLREPLNGCVALQSETPEVRDRLARLDECAEGTLGHALYEFYTSQKRPLPGEPGFGPLRVVQHDAHHVLASYGTTGAEEIALQAFLLRASNSREFFSWLTGAVALFELGRLGESDSFEGIEPQRGCATSREGRELLAEALERGAHATGEIGNLDVLACLDEPLTELRRKLGIPIRRSAPTHVRLVA